MVDISLDSDITTMSHRNAEKFGAEARLSAANPAIAKSWLLKNRTRDLQQSQRSLFETQRRYSDVITPEE